MDFDLTFVEELHVATQRDGGNGELGTVLVAARPQRATEADREAQDLDPTEAADPVMPELVERDQQPEADNHPPDRSDEVSHAGSQWRAGGGGACLARGGVSRRGWGSRG